MARLPVVASDTNTWGTVLNQFLQVGHNADGSLNSVMKAYNVRDYGALVDGTTDDSTAFTAAYTAAGATGGILTGFNGGTLIKGNDTLLSNVTIDGQGGTIKLKNGANTDLFSAQTGSINLSAGLGTGITGTLSNFRFKDITLDGNKANQSSGTSYPLRFYGYGYIFQNVRIKNGYTGGVLSDWNGSGAPTPDSMESQWSNVKIHDCNGIGLQMGGPHDSQFTNIIIYSSGSHNLHIAPNCAGALFLNLHSWSPGDVGVLNEAGYCVYSGCVSEGSNTMNVVLISSVCSWQGSIFEGSVGNGIQLGQTSGNTPYSGQIQQSGGLTTTVFCGGCLVDSLFNNCTSAHGAIWFANDGGNNHVKGSIYQTSGTGVTGTPNANTSYWITVNGLTADGTLGKSGGMQMATQGGNVILEGSVSLVQSATSPDPGAAGTIATAGVGIARVTPAAARTGIILAVGTINGQGVFVVNESTTAGNSITFNTTPATSHVANAATAAAINGGQGRKFVWTGTFWFPSV